MVQSVELLLDDEADAGVRADWALLAAAGLPSQALHTAPSNRPHVTLAALPAVPDGTDAGLLAACGGVLPLSFRLGALTVFGTDPYVVVRLVVPTAALLDLHRAVAAVVGTPEGGNLSPDAWTPHVTLARRVPGDLVPRALALLAQHERDAWATVLRRWDGDARREWPVVTREQVS